MRSQPQKRLQDHLSGICAAEAAHTPHQMMPEGVHLKEQEQKWNQGLNQLHPNFPTANGPLAEGHGQVGEAGVPARAPKLSV